MLAVRLHGPRDIRFDELPASEAGPSQVVVRPIWCGLCGTDVKQYLGTHPAQPGHPEPYPFILGHEFSARVVDVGPDVNHVEVGDCITVLPLRHCGNCLECWEGQFHLCRNKEWSGLGAASGGLAEEVVLDVYQATPAGRLSDEQAAVVEPAAVALNAVMSAPVRPGDIVLVAGLGPIGALALLAAQAAGATAVYVSEKNLRRSSRVGELGGVLLGDSFENQSEQLLTVTQGRGADVAVDCTGAAAALDACVKLVRPGGTVVVPSVHREAPRVDVLQMTRKSLTMVGSVGYSRSVWQRTIELIASGTLPAERVVTSRISRDEVVPKGLEALTQADQSEIKILVRVDKE